jgi:hypothetical protein
MKANKYIKMNLHLSWLIASILSWFFFDWQIALMINLFVADIKYNTN